jgi:hypothetical protein
MMVKTENNKYIELFFPKDFLIRKKGEYIVEHSEPWYVADMLMRCIANKVGKQAVEPSRGETKTEAVRRFKISKGHVEILSHMMMYMDEEVMPALKRLYSAQYGEEEK